MSVKVSTMWPSLKTTGGHSRIFAIRSSTPSTTKPPGKGTGLGLNVVYRIVTKHRGSVSVAAGDEGGACSSDLPRGDWFMRLRTRLIILIGTAAVIPRHPGIGRHQCERRAVDRKAADSQAGRRTRWPARSTCGCSFRSFRLRTKSMHSTAKLNDRKLLGFQQLRLTLSDVRCLSGERRGRSSSSVFVVEDVSGLAIEGAHIQGPLCSSSSAPRKMKAELSAWTRRRVR